MERLTVGTDAARKQYFTIKAALDLTTALSNQEVSTIPKRPPVDNSRKTRKGMGEVEFIDGPVKFAISYMEDLNKKCPLGEKRREITDKMLRFSTVLLCQ